MNTTLRALAALLAALASLFHALPPAINTALSVAGLLVLTDTLTGLVVAIYRRDLASKKLRRFIPKIAQYAGLVALGGAIALLSGSHGWVTASLWAICAIECLSIAENLTKLEKVGVNLGPARPLLQRIGTFLADGATTRADSVESHHV